jgi:hypothetical protein
VLRSLREGVVVARSPGVKLIDGSAVWKTYPWSTVELNPGRAKPGESIVVDAMLPGQELLKIQCVTAAGVLRRHQTAAYGRDDFGFPSDDPALGLR